MYRYILKRLILAIPLLIGISIVSYLVMRLAPGDPTLRFFNPRVSTEALEAMRHNMGLDQPVYVQYFYWLSHAVRGDLGYSFVDYKPVVSVVLERLPATISLMGVSLLLAVLVAVPIGIVSAVRQYSALDYVMTVISFAGSSMPSFWLGLMLLSFFAGQLGWFPFGGMGSLEGAGFWDSLKHYVLPVAALSFGHMAAWTRYQRASLLEVIRQDYIRTARAKGISNTRVILKHALRNAVIPIVTLLGLSLPNLVGGAFITETIFSWPGMGRLGVDAVFSRDYPVVMGVTIFSGAMVILGNLIADILYTVVDPRIRYDHS